MEELFALSDATTIPGYLREPPDRIVDVALVETRIQELPFDQLTWQNFERLVFRLARSNSDVVYCAPYGRSGQAQDGIDVYARLSGGGYVCWQARNREGVGPSEIKKVVDDFRKGRWAESVERFVLCLRASLADTGVQDAIEKQAARLHKDGIVFECVDGNLTGFWRSFAPYLSRSPRLRTMFLKYCEGESVVLEGPTLLTLSRLVPSSSLLRDCCKRILTAEFDQQVWSDLDAAQSTVVASKCLASYFPEDSEAVNAIVTASDSLRAQGGALVGLASNWPDQEIVVREYRNLLEVRRWPGLLVCAKLWVLAAQGTREQVATTFAQFVTRRASSPWDFPEDALGAFRTRLERDPQLEKTLRQLAVDVDEPSVRASTVRLLSSMATSQSQDLAEEMLAAECRRSGPPRFALDILTNRIRPARELMREALKMFK